MTRMSGVAPELLAGEHRAGAAEAARDLVEDQERTVSVAALAYFAARSRPAAARPSSSASARRPRRDVALHLQDVVDVVGEPLEAHGRRCRKTCGRSSGGTCSVPGRSGPTLRRKRASPPTEIASRLAPWKASHIESVLWRPVAKRASFSAMPIAAAPLGARSTLSSRPGASSRGAGRGRWRARWCSGAGRTAARRAAP